MKNNLIKKLLSFTEIVITFQETAADSETEKDSEYEEYSAAEYIYEQVGAYDGKEIFYPDASLWSMATAPIEKDSSSGTYRLTDSSEWTL